MASDRSSVEPPRWSGRLVVFVLLGFGLLLAGGARIWHGFVERRPLEFWGDASVRLIHSADEGEVWVLGAPPAGASTTAGASPSGGPAPAATAFDPDAATDFILVDGLRLPIEKRAALAPDSSFVHLRRILLSDYCYQWNSPPSSDPPRWAMAMRMHGAKGTLVVLFDFDHRRVRDLQGTRTAVLSPLALKPFAELAARAQTPAGTTVGTSSSASPTVAPTATK